MSFHLVFVCFSLSGNNHCITPLHRTSRKNPVFPFSPIIMFFVENVGNSCDVTVHVNSIKFRRACYLFTLDSCILIYSFCRLIIIINNYSNILNMHIFETVQLYEPITVQIKTSRTYSYKHGLGLHLECFGLQKIFLLTEFVKCNLSFPLTLSLCFSKSTVYGKSFITYSGDHVGGDF